MLAVRARDFEAGRALAVVPHDFVLALRALALGLRDLLLEPCAFLTLVARDLTQRTDDLAMRDFEVRDLERALQLRLRAAEVLRLRDFFAPVRQRHFEAAFFDDLARLGLASTGPSFRVEARLTGVMCSGQFSALAVFFVDVSDLTGLAARARLRGAALADFRFPDALDDRDELTAELLRFLVVVAFFETAGARARLTFFSSDGLAAAVRTAG